MKINTNINCNEFIDNNDNRFSKKYNTNTNNIYKRSNNNLNNKNNSNNLEKSINSTNEENTCGSNDDNNKILNIINSDKLDYNKNLEEKQSNLIK